MEVEEETARLLGNHMLAVGSWTPFDRETRLVLLFQPYWNRVVEMGYVKLMWTFHCFHGVWP